jgi:hypothetical protein
MRSLVVYESMFGNTHRVAEAIAAGLTEAGCGPVDVVPVDRADRALVEAADLLGVGAPPPAHGLSRPASRRSSQVSAARPDSGLVIEPHAGGAGVREWMVGLGSYPHKPVAVFDTRLRGPGWLTGRASKHIAHGMVDHGMTMVTGSESFIVTKASALATGEAERARRWGVTVARRAGVPAPGPAMS